MVEVLLQGLALVMTGKVLLLMTVGVIFGIVFGAIPGLTATMGVALGLPITFGMTAIEGLSFLCSIYIGGVSGGLISAILLKIPGTPSSIATTFDGAPMAKRGEAGRALGIGIAYSFIGTVFSLISLIFIAPPIANIALKFGSFEYFAVSVFALTIISSLSEGSMLKALISGVLGIAVTTIGAAPIDGFPRFTFGITALNAGFDILSVLIGMYAVAEVLQMAGAASKPEQVLMNFKIKGLGFSLKEFREQAFNMIRSAFIGIGIGILPGLGGATSNLIAYAAAKNASKYPEKFGTGVMDGIVASETSNNASVGGALIPLLTLGIPGDAVTALMLGGFMIHGLTPGPLLFDNNGPLVYGIFIALLISTVLMFVLELFGIRLFAYILKVPKHILYPFVICLSVIGSFGLNNRISDVYALLIFGFLGYAMNCFEFPLAPFVLGFILGPLIETNLRRGLSFSGGNFWAIFTRPISCVFIILTIGAVLFPMVKYLRRNIRKKKG